MKKVVLILAAAAAVAACAKNEVITNFANGEDEITFNVAPKTKALGDTQTDFNTDNVFTAYALYLGPNKTWAANATDAQLYINNSEISYKNNVWKNQTTPYYWPKDGGSLTFFAYSYNKGNMDTAEGTGMGFQEPTMVGEELHYGINGAVDVVANKNVDFLVADIAADKRANENVYTHNGVPTLFKHKLSQVVFTAKVKEEYANKKFEINEITFVQIPFSGSYLQYPEAMSAGTAFKDQSYAKGVAQVVTKDAATVVAKDGEGEGQILYVPQTFDATKKLVIKYTVTTNDTVVENCEQEIVIKDKFTEWQMGKRYTFNITFGLNEITWDPAVENWEDVTAQEITIE